VAWVRLASLIDTVSIEAWLDATLPPVASALTTRGAHSLAWMDYWDWAGPHLCARGFLPLTDVETMAKADDNLPPAPAPTATVRLAHYEDLAAVSDVDAAAFSPHWRNSRATIRRRFEASPLFLVVEREGRIVGYAEGDIRPPAAHLNRVAVHPLQQGKGIGTLLTVEMLQGFWCRGARRVTLNTQAHNEPGHRLYRRLGFTLTGERATAWELDLQPRT
jgi:ribosomal-protein-alanine N-acetyltransferase